MSLSGTLAKSLVYFKSHMSLPSYFAWDKVEGTVKAVALLLWLEWRSQSNPSELLWGHQHRHKALSFLLCHPLILSLGSSSETSFSYQRIGLVDLLEKNEKAPSKSNVEKCYRYIKY